MAGVSEIPRHGYFVTCVLIMCFFAWPHIKECELALSALVAGLSAMDIGL